MKTLPYTDAAVHPMDAAAQVRNAQALARAGRDAEAESLWRAILHEHPDSLAAATGLVKTLEARGERGGAEAVLRSFLDTAPSPAGVLAAARLWEQWQDSPGPDARTVRIALTGTGTLNPLAAHLRVACAQAGLHPALTVSDFGQWAQDLLSPGSTLYRSAPEIIILLLEPSALFPKAIGDPQASADDIEAERTAGVAQIENLLTAARHHAPAATVILHTFALPDHAPLGILDLTSEHGQRRRFEETNRALTDLARSHAPHVLLFDQERAEARHGKGRVRDDRLWYMAGVPFSDSFLPVMAAEYLRLIRPLKGLTRKCIVLDLDNTLWGGVIGEDGINQIKLGGSAAPGNAFYDFQAALKGLQRRGVLLALCSKNNPDDVWPVLDGHPSMLLRRPDFAAARINWDDKASNIAEIARELNIGLDSLVFLDDNPAERGLVRQRLPQVLTPDLPRDPASYTRSLLAMDVFETLALTQEDQRRSALYQEQKERERFRESLSDGGDVSAHLHGLGITVRVGPATPFTLPRIAQLINKTNQFNLTTRRYTEVQVQAMADDPSRWGVYAVSVADRFGDSGLTGVAVVQKRPDVWEIDSFLLSCRILGRGVEQALLRYVADQARGAGAAALHGLFLPTAKNAPAADFYPRMGMRQGTPGDAAWRLPLDDGTDPPAYPEWLTIESGGD